MQKNEGTADRAIRMIVGLALFLVAFMAFESMLWTIILAVFGIIVFITGLTGRCLTYVPFKINTTKAGKNQTETSE